MGDIDRQLRCRCEDLAGAPSKPLRMRRQPKGQKPKMAPKGFLGYGQLGTVLAR
jgi:hypothetical protein